MDTKTLHQEVIFKILCSSDRVGSVIGKGGAIIKALQSDTGATITIGATITDCDEQLVTVTASEVSHVVIFYDILHVLRFCCLSY